MKKIYLYIAVLAVLTMSVLAFSNECTKENVCFLANNSMTCYVTNGSNLAYNEINTLQSFCLNFTNQSCGVYQDMIDKAAQDEECGIVETEECNINADCPREQYCSGSLACSQSYSCQYGECVKQNGSCTTCPNGCSDGACIQQNIVCYNDSDCGESSFNLYCYGDMACTNSSKPFCSNPGTPEAQCSKAGGGGCTTCPYGCDSYSGICNRDPGLITIKDCDGLFAVRYNLTADYALANDIDCTGFDRKGIGFPPIYNFEGTFDGKGHKILGLYFGRPDKDYVGLFGSTRGAKIQDVHLVDAKVYGNKYVGALIGAPRDTEIRGCSASGQVILKDSFCWWYACDSKSGGMFGSVGSNSKIIECASHVDVQAGKRWQVGGLVGYLRGRGSDIPDSVVNSYADGTVSGDGYKVGGLVGDVDGGQIINSYYVGKGKGLIGYDYKGAGYIRNSFYDSTVAGYLGKYSRYNAKAIAKPTEDMQNPDTFTSVGWTSPPWFLKHDSYPSLKDSSAVPGCDAAEVIQVGESTFEKIGEKDYNITLMVISGGGEYGPAQANFIVNGEVTGPLNVGDSFALSDGTAIQLMIVSGDKAGFCLRGLLKGCSDYDVSGSVDVGQTASYRIDEAYYNITLMVVSGDSSDNALAKFIINGEMTASLAKGDLHNLQDGSILKIDDFLMIKANDTVKTVFFCLKKGEGVVNDTACTDTDSGLDYYTQGTVTGLEVPGIYDTWTDYCGISGNEIGKLVEYICREDDYGQKVLYDCPEGCSSGVCLQNQTNTTCIDECSYSGQLACQNNYARTCGNYDTDSCLEYNAGTYCPNGCLNGYCQSSGNETNSTGNNT